MRLAEVQDALREIVTADPARPIVSLRGATALAGQLVGGVRPSVRLAVHRRHYRASLLEALRTKFPATAWLVGEPTLVAMAEEFVQQHPPRRPCIAEYGDSFPQHLAARLGETLPYVPDFALVEWQLGQVSVAVDAPPLTLDTLSALAGDDEVLARCRVTVQHGWRVLPVRWPVERLFERFFTGDDTTPTEMAPASGHLLLRGARGEVTLERVAPDRARLLGALLEGLTLAEALASVPDETRASLLLAELIAGGAITALDARRPAQDLPSC